MMFSCLTSNPSITVNHNINEQTTVNTYRFFIEWNDSINETMNNADDVDASTSGEASIAVNIHFIQRAANSQNQGSGSKSFFMSPCHLLLSLSLKYCAIALLSRIS